MSAPRLTSAAAVLLALRRVSRAPPPDDRDRRRSRPPRACRDRPRARRSPPRPRRMRPPASRAPGSASCFAARSGAGRARGAGVFGRSAGKVGGIAVGGDGLTCRRRLRREVGAPAPASAVARPPGARPRRTFSRGLSAAAAGGAAGPARRGSSRRPRRHLVRVGQASRLGARPAWSTAPARSSGSGVAAGVVEQDRSSSGRRRAASSSGSGGGRRRAASSGIGAGWQLRDWPPAAASDRAWRTSCQRACRAAPAPARGVRWRGGRRR